MNSHDDDHEEDGRKQPMRMVQEKRGVYNRKECRLIPHTVTVEQANYSSL